MNNRWVGLAAVAALAFVLLVGLGTIVSALGG
jgi:hypothetical protein